MHRLRAAKARDGFHLGAARLFLADNGYRLSFDQVDAAATVEGLAAGKPDEAALEAWFRARIAPPW